MSELSRSVFRPRIRKDIVGFFITIPFVFLASINLGIIAMMMATGSPEPNYIHISAPKSDSGINEIKWENSWETRQDSYFGLSWATPSLSDALVTFSSAGNATFNGDVTIAGGLVLRDVNGNYVNLFVENGVLFVHE